jgi:microcystin-dependent protein
MSTPYLAELRIVSFNFAPRGWALCNGQLLPINQNQALFSLLGTTYGGDGRVTFALPNLQGATPMHIGTGYNLGQAGGETAHTLTVGEMPAHTHPVRAGASAASSQDPTGDAWAGTGTLDLYAQSANTSMGASTVTTAGGNQPHFNMPPYLVLNVVIALVGVFPSRN